MYFTVGLWRDGELVLYKKMSGSHDRAYIVDLLVNQVHAGIFGIGSFSIEVSHLTFYGADNKVETPVPTFYFPSSIFQHVKQTQ